MGEESDTKRFTTSLRNNQKFINEHDEALKVTYLDDAADHMDKLQAKVTALEADWLDAMLRVSVGVAEVERLKKLIQMHINANGYSSFLDVAINPKEETPADGEAS